jgi:hypothetical protein
MRYLLEYNAPVTMECDEKPSVRTAIRRALDGYTFYDDTVLPYLDEDLKKRGDFRGGYLRLRFKTNTGQLGVAIELDTFQEFSSSDLQILRHRLDGQMTDGIGAGAFDEISDRLSIELEILALESESKSTLTALHGDCWLPHLKDLVTENNQLCIAAAESVIAEARTKRTGFKGEVRNLFQQLKRISPFPTELQLKEFSDAITGLSQSLDNAGPNSLPYVNFQSPELLRLLLDIGLDPNSKDRDGHTLLYLATGNVECLRLLIARGADVNATNNDVYNHTALMRAASFGEVSSVQFLLDNGADPSIKTMFGDTALDDAKKNTHHGDPARTITLLALKQ